MKKNNSIFILCIAALLMVAGCQKDNGGPDTPGTDVKYVLMTLSDRVTGDKAGFVSAFDEMPTGNIDNIGSKSLQGQGMGGFRTYKNQILKIFSTEDYAKSIERLSVAADGKVSVDKILLPGQSKFGSGNFVIADDETGFYWDADEPLKIQKFNPATLSKTGSIDLKDVVNERGTDEAGILFRSIGQKFLAVKDGKLFANITYADSQGGQQGFFDDFYEDVYIAVIDIATSEYEKTIKVEDTGSIAYINENHMYDFDSNGDLYMVFQGKSAIGGKSKIARIKANSTDIDDSWELKFTDFRAEDDGKFVGVFAKEGKLILVLNTEPLTGGPDGNINSDDIWKFYTVDIASKAFTSIDGMPVGTNPGAAQAATEIDGQIYLRGSTSKEVNGYFLYDEAANNATQVFNVDVGGAVSGLYKIEID